MVDDRTESLPSGHHEPRRAIFRAANGVSLLSRREFGRDRESGPGREGDGRVDGAPVALGLRHSVTRNRTKPFDKTTVEANTAPPCWSRPAVIWSRSWFLPRSKRNQSGSARHVGAPSVTPWPSSGGQSPRFPFSPRAMTPAPPTRSPLRNPPRSSERTRWRTIRQRNVAIVSGSSEPLVTVTSRAPRVRP